MGFFRNYKIKDDYLKSRQTEQLQALKKNRDLEGTKIKHQGIFGHLNHDLYKKKKVQLFHGDSLDIITNQNLARDTTVLWFTKGERVRQALRRGLLKPQALTAKAIQAIGKYCKKTAEREIKSRIVSRLNYDKMNLVNDAQDAIESLQGIERYLGHRLNDQAAASKYASELAAEIDAYMKEEERLSKEIEPYLNALREKHVNKGHISLEMDDLRRIVQAKAHKKNIAAAAELKVRIEKHKSQTGWLETSGNEAIVVFLKERILHTARETQALNQILTHKSGTGAFFRGDLNGFIEDMVKVTRDHDQDLHNPVTCAHQLAYPRDMGLVIDSDFHTDQSSEELNSLMMGVSIISGDNEPLNDANKKGKIDFECSATKWRHWRSFYDDTTLYETPLFKNAKHFFCVVIKVLLSPFNLLETLVRGTNANWLAKVRARFDDPEEDIQSKKIFEKSTDYYALAHRVKKQTDLSTKIGLELHKALTYLFWEGLAKGLYDGMKQITKLPSDLFIDFQNQNVVQETALCKLKEELEAFKKEKRRVLEKSLIQIETKGLEDKTPYAQPEVSLKPYHSHGLLNGAVTGFREFVELFAHNMFAKHPFTAMVSSFGAGASFVAFFAKPLAIKIFGKNYIDFLQGQGYLWTNDIFSASMAGSFTNFKLVGMLIEAIENGPDSWLSKGISTLLNDPASTITYTTLAWAIGYALVDLVEIPGISAELRKHIGNPPQLSEIFGGAKMGIIAYQLFSSPHADTELLQKDYVAEAVKNYQALCQKEKIELSQSELEEFKALVFSMVSPQNMEVFQKRLKSAKAAPLSPEQTQFSLMLNLGMHKEDLADLSPLLKARLKPLLSELVSCSADARAIDKCLDPGKYAQKSTLRSFLGRGISYIPTLIRCGLSPIAGLVSGSPAAFMRPWKELGEMVLDDFTSTFQALSRFTQ